MSSCRIGQLIAEGVNFKDQTGLRRRPCDRVFCCNKHPLFASGSDNFIDDGLHFQVHFRCLLVYLSKPKHCVPRQKHNRSRLASGSFALM